MKTRIILVVLVCVFVTAPLLAQGPPAESGPNVIRDEAYGWWWYFTDAKRGYVAFVGADPVAICSGGDADSWWNYQENYPPAEEGLIHFLAKGDDVPASVYPISIWDYGACEYILSFPPIAAGTADVVITDNDLDASLYDHNRKNAYGLSAHGALTAPDGERMIFNGGFRCVYDADVDEVKCKIKIVLN
jgi:hypothetical protein